MHRITSWDYSGLLRVTIHDKQLFEPDYKNIYKQYLEDGMYLALLGFCDFAESFLTAEWMYDSMKEAQAMI